MFASVTEPTQPHRCILINMNDLTLIQLMCVELRCEYWDDGTDVCEQVRVITRRIFLHYKVRIHFYERELDMSDVWRSEVTINSQTLKGKCVHDKAGFARSER